MVYIAKLEALRMTIHLLQTALIIGSNVVQVAALKHDKAPIKVSVEYSDFANIFLAEETLVLLECIELNELTIELENGKQLSYGPIYQ